MMRPGSPSGSASSEASVVKLAALAADQAVGRAFGAGARIKRAFEIIRE
jgi:hypothetical protein